MLGERGADVAASGVEHEPHRILGVEAHFDEVIASAERSELKTRSSQERLSRRVERFETFEQLARSLHPIFARLLPRGRVVVTAADGHDLFDGEAQLSKVVG